MFCKVDLLGPEVLYRVELLCRVMSESYWNHCGPYLILEPLELINTSHGSYEVVLWSYIMPIFDYDFNKLI